MENSPIGQSEQEYNGQCSQSTDEDIDSSDESDSVNPDDWLNITDFDSEATRKVVIKQRSIHRRKAQRKFAKTVAKARLLKRKMPKRVSRILKRYPNIGSDIENFVKERKVGANAWRRTEVLTFTYGKTTEQPGQRVSYGRIKKHLEEKYATKFRYVTIVQLCVARNRRRISAKQYKGIAKITCRKSRKGFSIKFNPDAHYSTAMYHSLGYLYFSTVLEPELTTQTDYLNKYTALLQVSSYMFMGTGTTSEVCCGVVKAHTIYGKKPAQHAADLRMLEENPEFQSLFTDKDIEYIRVDDCGDEAPSHDEVQFYWTERHLAKGNVCILITTRHSGGSYLNRVELQNGCLSVAHSNLFIPSTLAGPNYSDKGLDKEQLSKNLKLATDIYISKVDGAPCGQQPIRLLKGAKGEHAKYLGERRTC
jgi:hypothetical protein